MIIEQTISKNSMWDDLDADSHIEVKLTTDTGVKTFSIGEGESEDMTLGRDLSDAYGVSEMLKAAYEAGKKGEELTVISNEEE